MRRLTAVACLMSVVLVGAAPAGLSPDLRERFAAGLAAHKAGDWATAGREFADPVWAGTPLEDYALLFQAESQLGLGDVVAARALATQAADRTPESGLTPSALMRAASVRREAGDAAGAVTTLQRVVTRLADAPDAARARYALGEALLASGDQKEAARVFQALWLQAPAAFGDAAERQLKALADAGVTPPPPSAAERAARADRLLGSGLIERARLEAEALVAEKPDADPLERALRVLMNASRRLGRDDAALAAANDGLAAAAPERRPSWLLELGRLRQRRDREGALATLDRLVRELSQEQRRAGRAPAEGGAARGRGSARRGREDLREAGRRLPGRGRGGQRALAARLDRLVPRQSRGGDRAVDPPPGRARRAVAAGGRHLLGRPGVGAAGRSGSGDPPVRPAREGLAAHLLWPARGQARARAPVCEAQPQASRADPANPRPARARRPSHSRPIRGRRCRATRASTARSRCARWGWASSPTRSWTS